VGKLIKIRAYESKNISMLKTMFSEYTFVYMNTIFTKAKNVFELDNLDLNKHVIDITTVFYDIYKNEIYSRSILFDYILTIDTKFQDVVFTIDLDEKDNFFKVYTLLDGDDEVDFSIIGNDKVEQEEYVKENTANIAVNTIPDICEKLDEKLQGHDNFKREFKSNLLKFSYLNKINKRKIFSALLFGKSGIGKTESARILSNIMYPNEKQIKLNFGNYSTNGVLNSLIGSPPGYIGSREGGELINKIKESNSKIILIDEFEKADETVFNFFYELLEDGKFTDRFGKEHDLNGYIIIFTSNLSKDNYYKVVPEPLRSRFDMMCYFDPLTPKEKLQYIEKYSQRLMDDLEDNFKITFNRDKIKSELNELSKYENLRNMARKIEDIVVLELDSILNELK
jgi:hypothetical protein